MKSIQTIFKNRNDGIGNFIMPVEQNANQGPNRYIIVYFGYETQGTYAAEVLDRNTGAMQKSCNTADQEDIFYRMDKWQHEYAMTGKAIEVFDLTTIDDDVKNNEEIIAAENIHNYRPIYDCCLYCQKVGIYKIKDDNDRPILVCTLDEVPVQPTFTCNRSAPLIDEDDEN